MGAPAEPAMDPELAAFLDPHPPLVTDEVDWGNGFRFLVAAALTDQPPPLAFVTSARAVVLRGGGAEVAVLVQTDRGSRHVLPGGRREPGELPAATLRREVREETGWELGATAPLGFLHFHHLSSKPTGYPYPYPDFLNVVSVAWASTFSPGARLNDGYELDSAFLPVDRARALGLTRREPVFLDVAAGRNG